MVVAFVGWGPLIHTYMHTYIHTNAGVNMWC